MEETSMKKNIINGEVGAADTLDTHMCSTCLYAGNMSKMIQISGVPEQVHGTLKARAACKPLKRWHKI